MTDDWARKQIEEINHANERRRAEAEARVVDERIKRAQGPLLWERLRQSLIAKSQNFNREAKAELLIVEPSSSNEITIRLATKPSAMMAQYSPLDNSGRYVINRETQHFDIALGDRGEAMLRREGVFLHPEEFAESLLVEVIRPLKE